MSTEAYIDSVRKIPVPKRVLEFTSKDFRTKPVCGYSLNTDNYTEEELRKIVKNALQIVDGWNILQFMEEYPIVRYECDYNEVYDLIGDYRLNAFVESITVSTVLQGKRANFGSGKLTCEDIASDTIVYFTDRAGINHAIIQEDLYNILLRKPKLVVSPEGVLVFYTDKDIIATLACNNGYHWINGHVIEVGNKKINRIEVCDDFCKVVLVDDNDDAFALSDEISEYSFKLEFEMNGTEYNILSPKATEL